MVGKIWELLNFDWVLEVLQYCITLINAVHHFTTFAYYSSFFFFQVLNMIYTIRYILMHYGYSEAVVAMATADVMVYDDATKRWVAPDGGIEPARSQVRILRNTHTNAFRIVGTRLQVCFFASYFMLFSVENF